jgi:tripartite-type tricarboxylate transporter receptor subunit TctC
LIRRIAAVAGLLALVAGTAAAQTYPSKPVRFIVPYPAGGATDILGRTVGQKLSERWGQPVVVENRAGAGGNLGSDLVAKAAPDGYTIGLGNNATHATNASLYPTMPYDTERDFAPVSLLAAVTNVLVVNPQVRAKTVADLVRIAKAEPGRLDYASTGSGSAAHLTGELFKTAAGIEMVHVPYRGGPPAVTDLVSGQVKAMFATAPSVLPQIQAGRLTALAVTSARRQPGLPDVPTVAESGFPGFESDAWFAVFAPAGTPAEIVARLNADIRAVLAQPEVVARLKEQGFEVATSTPDELRRHVTAEIAKWGAVVKASGAKPD